MMKNLIIIKVINQPSHRSNNNITIDWFLSSRPAPAWLLRPIQEEESSIDRSNHSVTSNGLIVSFHDGYQHDNNSHSDSACFPSSTPICGDGQQDCKHGLTHNIRDIRALLPRSRSMLNLFSNPLSLSSLCLSKNSDHDSNERPLYIRRKEVKSQRSL